MTRGRRPNLTLEPSRQLQTQRAFRERKAAHLRHLEDTVKSQANKILQLKERLGEDVSVDEVNAAGEDVSVDEVNAAGGEEEEEKFSNENDTTTASSSSPNKKRRRVKSEHASSDDALKQALYTPPTPSTSTTSPIPMSPLLASNSAPPSHTCSQCQRLRHQNAELNRLLADAEKQLAFYRQQSQPQQQQFAATTSAPNTSATTSASSGSGFSEIATSPPSPSSPVYGQRLPYTAPYASKVPPQQQQQHTRIQWTQPLSPSLQQMQYSSVCVSNPAQAAYNHHNNYTRTEASNPYHAHQRYSTAPDSLDEHSSRSTTNAPDANLPPASNTPAAYHPPPPKCQPSRPCDPPQLNAAPVGVQADQDKCCLGLFACDADGRIIV